MHRALYIEEIASEIIRYLNMDDLRRVLKTCKALHAPALSAIWLQQESLSVLTELLPKDLVVDNVFSDLCVWDSTTTQELYSDSQIAMLDSEYRILGRPLNDATGEDEEAEEEIEIPSWTDEEVEEVEEEMSWNDEEVIDGIPAEASNSPAEQQHVLVRLTVIKCYSWLILRFFLLDFPSRSHRKGTAAYASTKLCMQTLTILPVGL